MVFAGTVTAAGICGVEWERPLFSITPSFGDAAGGGVHPEVPVRRTVLVPVPVRPEAVLLLPAEETAPAASVAAPLAVVPDAAALAAAPSVVAPDAAALAAAPSVVAPDAAASAAVPLAVVPDAAASAVAPLAVAPDAAVEDADRLQFQSANGPGYRTRSVSTITQRILFTFSA